MDTARSERLPAQADDGSGVALRAHLLKQQNRPGPARNCCPAERLAVDFCWAPEAWLRTDGIGTMDAHDD
jgi:hypothetical protein